MLFGATLIAGGTVGVAAKSVTIALQPGIAFLPVVVADAEGILREEAAAAGVSDLSVKLTMVSGGPAANDAIISGAADLVGLGIPPLLVVWDKTRHHDPAKIVAGCTILPYTLFTNDPSKKSIADFTDNDRIAVNATTSVSAMLLRIAAAKKFGDAGWQRLDSMMVSMPHPESMNAVLNKSGVTAYFSVPPFTDRLRRSRKLPVITTSKDILGEEATGGLIAARESFFQSNKALVLAFNRAMRRAIDLIHKDPRRAAQDYLKTVKVTTPLDDMIAIISDPDMGYSEIPKGIMVYADYMKKWGLIKHLPKSPDDVMFSDAIGPGAN
jgi:NitT/TauT family transport system substrate-binding protein